MFLIILLTILLIIFLKFQIFPMCHLVITFQTGSPQTPYDETVKPANQRQTISDQMAYLQVTNCHVVLQIVLFGVQFLQAVEILLADLH